MRYVLTAFDYSIDPPLPLQSIVIDNNIKFYTFYLPGTGNKLRQIYREIEEFKSVFVDKSICINDFKTHVKTFNLPKCVNYDIYDLNLPHLDHKCLGNIRKGLINIAKIVVRRKPKQWNKLLANSSVVYQYLEDRGVFHGYRRVFPRYSIETFAGRSKTMSFNLQGTTDKFDIRHIEENGYQVQFDWIGADLLIAAYMSGDKEMLGSFDNSDPYTKMAKLLNSSQFPREQCKRDFMRAIYSLSVNHPILELFPTFKKWMISRITQMREDGYLISLLGRKYRIKGDNELSVFNAQFQGGVAHAMQATLIRLFDDFSQNLLAEVHDTIVLVCKGVDLKELIEEVGQIMLCPLKGYVDNPPIMPVKISIGKRWRKWKGFRELRGSNVDKRSS